MTKSSQKSICNSSTNSSFGASDFKKLQQLPDDLLNGVTIMTQNIIDFVFNKTRDLIKEALAEKDEEIAIIKSELTDCKLKLENVESKLEDQETRINRLQQKQSGNAFVLGGKEVPKAASNKTPVLVPKAASNKTPVQVPKARSNKTPVQSKKAIISSFRENEVNSILQKVDSFLSPLTWDREANVLVIGLDGSGKSTMLNHFKTKDTRRLDSIMLNFGISVVKCKVKYLDFTAYDKSGQGNHYINAWVAGTYGNWQGIIFVVDSSDKLRLVEAKGELDRFLQHDNVKNCRIPILFFANKMDVQKALGSVRVSSALGLTRISNKPWHITSSNSVTGEGLHEGVEWLTNQIIENYERTRR